MDRYFLWSWLYRYFYEVVAAFSLVFNAVFVNLFRKKPIRETLCCGCGRSMKTKGWASHMTWPEWFVRHCCEEEK